MRKIFILIILLLIFLTGCNLKEGAKNFISGFEGSGETSNEQGKKEEVKDPLDLYSDVVTKTFDQSNEMLARFNNALDMLYAGQATEEEFALILVDILPESNKMLTELDSVLYDIDTTLYDFHGKLITLVNFQHELFLKSLEQANSPDVNVEKDKMREDYVKIKNEQTKLIQELKRIFAEKIAEQQKAQAEKKEK
ncbi:hypothetical protein [Calidifontibacillus erzurumensis]|uniref:hypothetical protein n=1 Tax=Calidifontibacillus erzurumensis TaxID=2741433 RepID=UPI0035B52673